MQVKKIPPEAPFEELVKYHDSDYITYMKNYYSSDQIVKNKRFGVGVCVDTPAFNKIYEFCQKTAGSSLLSSELLIQERNNVVLNWNGGYHHAKKSSASGFCYVNDIVLGILRLLEVYNRVLYIDIDVHHGDGVEEAFYHTNRVATLSFHQYCEETKFYPGTGNFDRIGQGEGKNFAVNVPLKPGVDDESFKHLFQTIFQKMIEAYPADVIFMQCGADSLIGDLIGRFRLSTYAHGFAVQTVLNAGIPTILSGCGGYTIQNVSRCWAYETSLACGEQLSNYLPSNLSYYQYYREEPYLHIADKSLSYKYAKNVSYWEFDTENLNEYAIYNDKSYLNSVIYRVLKQIKRLQNSIMSLDTYYNSQEAIENGVADHLNQI